MDKTQQAWIDELFRVHRENFGGFTMEGPDDPPAKDPVTDPVTDPAKAEKTLTQTEVNAIAAREKEAGKRAAETQLATDLGVDLATAKEIIKKARETEDAKKDEATKARESADAEKESATAEKNAAKAEVHETRLERAFARAGLDLETDADKAARIRRMVTVEAGASFDDVLADVNAIKKDFPELFGAKAGDTTTTRRTPGSDPKGKAPAPKGGEDRFAAGRARALRSRNGFVAKVENGKT